MTPLLGISGALRAASTNTKLLHAAARAYGAEMTLADLRLPLYDGDLEDAEGIPAGVQTLADQIDAAEAVLISTPEYNKAPPGVLKNALDWVSRVKGKKPWTDKPAAVMSAAAGRAGGERTQFFLRLYMVPFRPRLVMGPEVMIAASGQAFDADGALVDDFARDLLGKQMDELKRLVALR